MYFLRKNTKVFTWYPKGMLGIDLDIITHMLNVI